MVSTALQDYLQNARPRQLEELLDFLRIPSVSTDAEHRGDVRRAADFVREGLERAGLTARLMETAGHPVVYAERAGVENAPTVLVYGHYDVQPPEPLALWTSPPFEPVITDEKIVARGASDDKGQVYRARQGGGGAAGNAGRAAR